MAWERSTQRAPSTAKQSALASCGLTSLGLLPDGNKHHRLMTAKPGTRIGSWSLRGNRPVLGLNGVRFARWQVDGPRRQRSWERLKSESLTDKSRECDR